MNIQVKTLPSNWEAWWWSQTSYPGKQLGGWIMSTKVNDILFERAHEMLEFWTGTQLEHRIQAVIDMEDLEQLEYVVRQAEKAADIAEL